MDQNVSSHPEGASGFEYVLHAEQHGGGVPLMNHSQVPVLMSPSLPLLSVIFIHGDLQWDIFQVIISRSTTPDLIKIGMKLQEFFTQQFDTSKRALSTWGPGSYLPPKAPPPMAPPPPPTSSHSELVGGEVVQTH